VVLIIEVMTKQLDINYLKKNIITVTNIYFRTLIKNKTKKQLKKNSMKNLKLALFSIVFTAISGTTFAQNADEIISKYITTIGGAEKLKSVKSLKMEMITNAQGMEIPVEMAQKTGGSMYIKINLQGKEITQVGYDGNEAWTTNFMTMKAEKMDAESTENMKLNNADFPEALLDYKTKGYAAEFVGKETKEGTECFKVKFTKKPVTVAGVKMDDVMYYYFDTDNSLVIAMENEIREGPSKGQKSLTTMSDYQEVDGLFFPFAINQGGQDLKVKKIEINPTVDAKAFAFPTE
jgi:hypothetical protein